MYLPYYLSRHLSHNRTGTGRTGAVIAVLGVAVALAVMEITISVVVGFKEGITEKLDGFVAPITVSSPVDYYGARSERFIAMNDSLLNPIREYAPHAKIVPVVTQPAIIKTEEDFATVIITGHEADYPAEFEQANITSGEWIDENDEQAGLVISTDIAQKLGLKAGDKTTLCFFINEQIKARPFVVKGLFESGFGDYDKLTVYATSRSLRTVNKVDSTMITRLELRDIPLSEADSLASILSAAYASRSDAEHPPYVVTPISLSAGHYLSWLDLLDTNVVVIFILMSLIAGVTLISSLFIQVLDKVKAIGILRALGASDKLIRRMFTALSLRLVGIGLIVGNILGLGFIFVQNRWNILPLDPDMYYLDSVPAAFTPWLLLCVNLGFIVVSWMVIFIPARMATKLSPVSTLKFE